MGKGFREKEEDEERRDMCGWSGAACEGTIGVWEQGKEQRPAKGMEGRKERSNIMKGRGAWREKGR